MPSASYAVTKFCITEKHLLCPFSRLFFLSYSIFYTIDTITYYRHYLWILRYGQELSHFGGAEFRGCRNVAIGPSNRLKTKKRCSVFFLVMQQLNG